LPVRIQPYTGYSDDIPLDGFISYLIDRN